MADLETKTELRRFRNTVAGSPCDSTTGRWLPSTNPYTGRGLGRGAALRH